MRGGVRRWVEGSRSRSVVTYVLMEGCELLLAHDHACDAGARWHISRGGTGAFPVLGSNGGAA